MKPDLKPMKARRKATRILCGLFCLALISCGIENYIYLEPVEIASATSISSAHIVLPGGQPAEFTNYTIFYRIYISEHTLSGVPTEGDRGLINPALASHYATLDPYTTNDSVSPNAVGSVFGGLGYYPLYLTLNRSTELLPYEVLYSGSGTVDLDFTNDASLGPYMELSSIPGRHFLFRSGEGGFTAQPDRLLYNTQGANNLTDSGIISASVNADVNGKSGGGIGTHTYLSLYILATGIDYNYSPIYSRPKHIGIFSLPNP